MPTSKRQSQEEEKKVDKGRAASVIPQTKKTKSSTPEPIVTNKDFIDAVFHSVPEGAHVYGCSFTKPPDEAPSSVWFGGPIKARSLKRKSNYTSGDANCFYVVSTFKPNEKGQVRRSKSNFAAAHVLTLDDIGDGPSAKISWDKIKLPPSFVIETSPDNAQPGYILKNPETDADLFDRVVDALIHQGLAADADPGMAGVTRYVRLSVGTNNKTKYDPPHQHVLKEWHPERRYTLQDIIDAYGLDLAPPTPERTYNRVKIDVTDDPYVEVLNDLGLILTGEVKTLGDGRQMLNILCPFREEHPDRADEGAAYFIGAGFKCFHGHCDGRTFKDVKEKLASDHGVDTDALDHVMRGLNPGVLVDQFGDEPDNEAPDQQIEKKPKTWLEEMNDKYALVLEGGGVRVFKKVLDPELNQMMVKTFKPEAIKTLHDNQLVTFGKDAKGNPKKVGMGTAWTKHPKRNSYPEGTTLMANGEPPDGYYNLWTGWGVEPVAGDWSLMRAHIGDNICKADPDTMRYLMGWMARAVQKPEVQGETAVVLRGGKGVGKGILGNALVDMFGSHSLHLSKSDQLVGRFNAHLRTAVMVFADEAFFAGDKKNEGSLKALITEDTVAIEPKGVDLITAKNRTHIFMATNNAWAVPASHEERRYFVLDVSSARRGDFNYFGAIKKELADGGLAAMLQDLLEYDLSDFNVRAIPQTSALLDQKLLSLTGVDDWLYDCLQKGQIPRPTGSCLDWDHEGAVIPKTKAHEAFTNRAAFYKCARDIPGDSWFFKHTRQVIGGRDTRRGGVRSLIVESLAVCRVRFEEYMGQTIHWEPEPEASEGENDEI